MPKGIITPPEKRQEILRKIKEEGMSVADASATYGIGTKAIYTWMRAGVIDGNRNLILENNKLKKELEIAYRILGRLTAETDRPKR